ncbi:leucine-rich repeat-containing protein 24-like [Vespa velutina]|uniref:leucine-rich repeat-containing protein 24-like n=1 Tax=Vespa velutina TaxID=202808 RepID=UPI001FB38626|nr:leucine-rich repeat-containing protein 24-like [Vespa velutina]XP_047362737.1 leucine-rich repeat-containing protein 24-like [Vespa velutina]XP_047362738.1 leucine-rich repeat-containing protein 24-like [Vespa velutina]XP_047362739.1 leucine-rich repeat-containing protein 24-like [Vespa velutina]XP_047362740.1 leucine-rich repeat-containing protein 24-like [Vespa velutina]XP_047362742.1 leucine-rich repeat-containing protein 24-like [Vespa velutina]XP_047362743.1 leucine-rich repeat-contai
MCSSVRAWWWRGALLGTMMLAWTCIVEGCPSMCACKWKGGKEWVECANRDLKGLPQGAGEETQVLDLSDNHLVSLPPECFHALGLINLQRLYLGRSHISRIAVRAFEGLVGLVELDLTENLIDEIPTESFSSCPNLMRLTLNGNPIVEIKRGAFHRLVHLTNLELSHCRLEIIEEGAFDGLHSLEWLRLDGNRLTYMPNHTLPLGGSFRGLTLHNNPWLCDCGLRILQAWLKESAPAAPQESEPICDMPVRLRDRQIKTLKDNELACLPRIELQERVDVYEGSNVTFQCNVHAIPAATITWWFNGDICELQNENDSSTMNFLTFPRYIYRQRGSTNMSSTLYVYSVEANNDGVYSCVAENTAGTTGANVTLKVLFREKVTAEPPSDDPGSGYVAAIAAGALVGTLFVLGCVVGSIVFCVRKRRRDRKRNSKALVSQNKSVMPITKDTTTSLPSCRKGNGSLVGFEHQQIVSYTEREIGRAATLERREQRGGNLEESYGSPVSKYLTEPDLINEVPETTDVTYGQLYRHQTNERHVLEYDSGYPIQPPDLRPSNIPQLSYLDQDGYPLNFGLPKISFNNASTLPRLRTRMAEGSAVAPPARYSREAEFLARSTAGYDPVLPRTDARYTAEGYPYPPHQPVEQPIQQQLQQPVISPVVSPASVFPEVPFIPSPPAAYRGETTPLSPRSLLGKTAREAAAAAAARADELQPPHHPESPDEGYVGDAMDV